ncbi:MAG: hypothetical protein Q4G16_09615 [Cruoricaptor ignavus]|nr:hypothetical protein [Cruoricaptor ignavus]
MIHDKDYMMRQVRQFSNFISKMLLEKNEGKPDEELLVFETQMKDIFKLGFEELSSKTTEEIKSWIEEREEKYHAEYYELLGNIFYLKYKETENKGFAQNAKTFYELYLQKSQIFSIPIINRINELKVL